MPDSRFDWLCEAYKPLSKVPAYLTIIDIAGLVKGASTGAGLGNNFLSHIRAVDAIFHVVRILYCFKVSQKILLQSLTIKNFVANNRCFLRRRCNSR